MSEETKIYFREKLKNKIIDVTTNESNNKKMNGKKRFKP